jgi:ligand-binding sensor domain-containing protein
VITNGINGPVDMAVDSSGDLWVANSNGDTVVEYSRAELAKANPAPTVTIHPGGPAGGVAFDPSGDLWVGTGTLGVEEFNKAELAKSGSPSPVFTLSQDNCRVGFDRAGDLWMGSFAGGLVEYTKTQLAKSSSVAPQVVISSPGLSNLVDAAFDPSGDLWVPNARPAGDQGQANHRGRSEVVEFTKAELAKSGVVTPARTISGPDSGLRYSIGVAIEP